MPDKRVAHAAGSGAAGGLSQRLGALRNTAREVGKLGSLAMAQFVAEFLYPAS